MKLVALDRDYILGGEATPDEAKEIAMRCNAYDALLARNKELEELLSDSVTAIEIAINATKTGQLRNDLTELNIKCLTALKTPTDGK